MNPVTPAKASDLPRTRLFTISSACALLLGTLLLVAIAYPIVAILQRNAPGGWLPQIANNWLVLLFNYNAGLAAARFEDLYGVNPLDLALMALAAVLHLGLYAALHRSSKILSIVAVIQPWLGIALLVTTQLLGRSAVMGAGLVISIVMLRSNLFGKSIAWVGLLSSVLLLIGDFTTTADAHSLVIAIVIGIGYVLLVAWCFLVGRTLLQLGEHASAPAQPATG